MRGSRQITNDMTWNIIGYYFSRKNIVTYNNENVFQEMDNIDKLYDTIREYTIEVNGDIYNYYSAFNNEDKAILEKEHLNKQYKSSGLYFRNFKVGAGLYTIWERL